MPINSRGQYVVSVQKVLSGTGHAGRLRLMGKYIDHRLVARPQPDNIFWTDSTSSQKTMDCSNFLNLRNFETERERERERERETSEKHEIKSLDLQEMYQFHLSCPVASRFVPNLPRFEKIGAVNTFFTASTTIERNQVGGNRVEL